MGWLFFASTQVLLTSVTLGVLKKAGVVRCAGTGYWGRRGNAGAPPRRPRFVGEEESE